MDQYEITVITAVKGRRNNVINLLNNIQKYCDFNIVKFIFSFTESESYQLKDFQSDLDIISLRGACVLVVYPKSTGIYPALNEAIKRVDTCFLTFLHSDDLYVETINLELMKKVKSLDSQVVTFDIMIDGIVSKPRLEALGFPYADLGVNHMATIFKSDFHKEFLYDESFSSSSDWNTIIAMYENGANIKNINKTLVGFSLNGISNEKSLAVLKENLKIILFSHWNVKNAFPKAYRIFKEMVGYVIF